MLLYWMIASLYRKHNAFSNREGANICINPNKNIENDFCSVSRHYISSDYARAYQLRSLFRVDQAVLHAVLKPEKNVINFVCVHDSCIRFLLFSLVSITV